VLLTRPCSSEHGGWVGQAQHRHRATEPALTARFVGAVGPLRCPASDGSSHHAARHLAEQRL